MKGFFLSLFLASSLLQNPPQSYVSDQADLFPENTETEIEARLSTLESEKNIEMLVLSLKESPESLDDFTQNIFNTWGIGSASSNQGLLLVINPTQREVRVQTGFGLEGALPDALAFQWIEQELTPSFQKGDYDEGLLNFLEKVEALDLEQSPIVEDSSPGPFDFEWKSSDGIFNYWDFYSQSWAKGLGLGLLIAIFYPLLLLLTPEKVANVLKWMPWFVLFLALGFTLKNPLFLATSLPLILSFPFLVHYVYKKLDFSSASLVSSTKKDRSTNYSFNFSSFKSSAPKSGGSSFGGGSSGSSNSLGGGKSGGGGAGSRW